MRGFRFRGRSGGGGLGLTLLIGVAILFVASLEPQQANARWRLFGRRSGGSSNASYGSSGSRGTIAGSPAQVAAYKAGVQASRNRMSHIGGGYGGANAEGVGSGRTAQQALNNCCFTGRRPLVASAVRQGSNGMWYACKLFR